MTLNGVMAVILHYCKKLSSLQRLFRTTSTQLKQEISQKMIFENLQHIAKMSLSQK